jgi:hypothetical protein
MKTSKLGLPRELVKTYSNTTCLYTSMFAEEDNCSSKMGSKTQSSHSSEVKWSGRKFEWG